MSTTALTAGNTVSAEVPLIAEQAVRVRIEYSPRDRVMSIFWNDQTVIRHELPFLVTAPAQVRIGEDVRGAGGSLFRFWGRITVLERVVRPSS